MSWYRFRPYVSVAERRRQALKAAKKLAAKGRTLAAVELQTSKISTTFWGKAWCQNLESYSDYENRLPRGRTYVRNGSVIDLQVGPGEVEALVQGSDLYKVSIRIGALAPRRWKEFTRACAGKITNLLDLLQGRLSKDILTEITAKEAGLFPSPKEIKLGCSCPDWAEMCKHVAAVLYGVGSRLDQSPELFFTLRGVEMQELLSAAGASAAEPDSGTSGGLEGEDLAALFGVEIDTGSGSVTKQGGVSAVPRARGKAAVKKARPAKEEPKAGGKASAKKRAGAKKSQPAPASATAEGKTGAQLAGKKAAGKKRSRAEMKRAKPASSRKTGRGKGRVD
ncbi:MAG TPA: hypothetical protein VMN36_05825 [Verrucomicrobiales bacterium]|nr:hypothetical protein [Verrucomicrobiales bacterium]